MHLGCVDAIAFIETRHTYVETLTVVKVGPVDYAGRGACMLSDGSVAYCCDTVEGARWGELHHKPKVVPLQDQNGWLVTPYKGEPFIVRAVDLPGAM